MVSETRAVQEWLERFEAAIASGIDALLPFIAEDVTWRDLSALTWTVGKVNGRAAVADRLVSAARDEIPKGFRVAGTRTPPKATAVFGREVVEAFIEFDTVTGTCDGVLRLVEDPHGAWQAWLLLTRLTSYRGAGKPARTLHEQRYGFEPITPHENWREYRERRVAFADREPEVLIVGGGHSGVILAAQLEVLGVDALLVEKLPRLGDVWRNRYHSLALHFPTLICSFPFLPFPEAFPSFLSKDQLADWIELYATAMEVNTWTSTEFVQGAYDEATKTWDATVRLADGTERVLHPKHIVMATGFIGNIPRMPDQNGLDEFDGQVVHTADFKDGAAYADRNVLVIGAGTSGHDTALELLRHGARVTLLQRSPISIIRLETLEKRLRLAYPTTASIPETDLLGAANLVFPQAREVHAANAMRTMEEDAALLDRLAAAGFMVERDPQQNWQLKAWRGGSGYYIDVGASEPLANGDIALVRSQDTVGLEANGLRMNDGSLLALDAIVCATGFQNSTVDVDRFFGADVAERLGDIHIMDDYADGEWSNAWSPTAQDGLWFISGGPPQTRVYAPILGFQIRAKLDSASEESGAPCQVP